MTKYKESHAYLYASTRGLVCDECNQPIPVDGPMSKYVYEFGTGQNADFKLVCSDKCREAAKARNHG